MRYYLSAVLLLIISFFAVDVFAQSSDTEVLKDKVERLESDLAELKELLKQQVEKDAQKEKEIASLKEKDAQKEKDLSSLKVEVQKKEVVAVSESPSVEETTLTQKSAEFSGKKLSVTGYKLSARVNSYQLLERRDRITILITLTNKARIDYLTI